MKDISHMGLPFVSTDSAGLFEADCDLEPEDCPRDEDGGPVYSVPVRVLNPETGEEEDVRVLSRSKLADLDGKKLQIQFHNRHVYNDLTQDEINQMYQDAIDTAVNQMYQDAIDTAVNQMHKDAIDTANEAVRLPGSNEVRAFLIHPELVKVSNTVADKQELYGNAFEKNGEILAILYPDGVSVDDMPRVALLTRMLDKIARYAHNNDKDGENPLEDLMGYCILGLSMGE